MLVEDMVRMCEERGIPLRLDEDGALVIPPEASERLSGLYLNIFMRHARRSITRILRGDEALRRRAEHFGYSFTSDNGTGDDAEKEPTRKPGEGPPRPGDGPVRRGGGEDSQIRIYAYCVRCGRHHEKGDGASSKDAHNSELAAS